MNRNPLLTTAAAALLAVATQAQAVTITFETLAAGTVLSNQFAGLGVTFTPNAFSGTTPTPPTAQGWATNTDMTVVSSTGTDVGGLGTPLLVSGNILRSFNGWLGEFGSPSFAAVFSTPVNTFSATFASVTEFASTRLFVYNGATLLSTVAGADTGVAPAQFILSFAAPSITRVVITPGTFSDWVGVDNIVFQPVPEPATWGLMALGLAGLLILKRRRS